MAMVRLPTRESDGKANLHMGAIGVGIDIAKGEATYITYKGKIIEEIPDMTGNIRGVKIPYWDKILEISSKVQLITNLEYLAVDIALDKNYGPVLLEINARAGLGVQIANLAKLRKRLQRIEGVKVNTPSKGVRIAKDMFGNTVEKEIKHLSGKEVIGIEETIEIIDKKGTYKVSAVIDTSKKRSIIDEKYAQKIGLLHNLKRYDQEKGTLKIKFTLKEKRIQTIVDVENIPNNEHKFILATRDLGGFLIDTNPIQKKKPVNIPTISKTEDKKHTEDQNTTTTQNLPINYQNIDQQLNYIDSKLKLLYHLKPLNLKEEKERFLNNPDYNPQFEYPKLKFNPLELIDQLEKIDFDESNAGKIFEDKKHEILKKIAVLEAIEEERFTQNSINLFGKPDQNDLQRAIDFLKAIPKKDEEKEDKTNITAEEAEQIFNEVFKSYGLHKWRTKIKENLVARCVAGKHNRMFVRAGAKFRKKHIKSLIVHEIETHIITAENGKNQIYEIFNRGSANYLQTQEGLAMYNVEKETGDLLKHNIGALSHVVSIHAALQQSFSEVYHTLRELKVPKNKAFASALKAKRGLGDTSKPGAFTKDLIYFKGYYQIKEYIEKGGTIKDLYLGKFNLDDLEIIKKIPGIIPPKILPRWLDQ